MRTFLLYEMSMVRKRCLINLQVLERHYRGLRLIYAVADGNPSTSRNTVKCSGTCLCRHVPGGFGGPLLRGSGFINNSFNSSVQRGTRIGSYDWGFEQTVPAIDLGRHFPSATVSLTTAPLHKRNVPKNYINGASLYRYPQFHTGPQRQPAYKLGIST